MTQLHQLLAAQESRLRLALDEARSAFGHSGDKGLHVEAALRAFLSTHLAARHRVGHGEVIDTHGGRSGQVDVVVSYDDQPFAAQGNEPGLYFIEGIALAGEVKSKLTTTDLDRALAAGSRFKALVPDRTGWMASSNPSDSERFYDRPPFCLVAFETKVNPEVILKRISEAEAVGQTSSGQPITALDAAFILGTGSAINYGDGNGALRFQVSETGESIPGWIWHGTEPGVLVDMLLWIHAVMPRAILWNSPAVRYLLSTSLGTFYQPPHETAISQPRAGQQT